MGQMTQAVRYHPGHRAFSSRSTVCRRPGTAGVGERPSPVGADRGGHAPACLWQGPVARRQWGPDHLIRTRAGDCRRRLVGDHPADARPHQADSAWDRRWRDWTAAGGRQPPLPAGVRTGRTRRRRHGITLLRVPALWVVARKRGHRGPHSSTGSRPKRIALVVDGRHPSITGDVDRRLLGRCYRPTRITAWLLGRIFITWLPQVA